MRYINSTEAMPIPVRSKICTKPPLPNTTSNSHRPRRIAAIKVRINGSDYLTTPNFDTASRDWLIFFGQRVNSALQESEI